MKRYVTILLITIIIVVIGINIMFLDQRKKASLQKELRGKIVFGFGSKLYVIEFKDSGVKESYYLPGVGSTPSEIDAFYPCWSPDGQRIVFTRNIWKTTGSSITVECQLNIVSSDGSDLKKLVDMKPTLSGYPSWSPDGQKIAFVAGLYDANFRDTPHVAKLVGELYVVDIDDPQPKKVTEIPVLAGRPSWSSDSQRIMFASSDREIMIVNLDGSNVKKITSGSGPSWSPDGRSITFYKDGNIYKMDLGSRKKQLLVSKYFWYSPPWFSESPPDISWSPDSKFILYIGQSWWHRILSWSVDAVIVSTKGTKIRLCEGSAPPWGCSWVKPGMKEEVSPLKEEHNP